MGDAVEPGPMQAGLPMQSDAGAFASFKPRTLTTSPMSTNATSGTAGAHYAEIDGLFYMPVGLHLVPRSPDLTMILQLRTLYNSLYSRSHKAARRFHSRSRQIASTVGQLKAKGKIFDPQFVTPPVDFGRRGYAT
eukprot:5927478-Pleurochrysis_carterae.AAC.1